VSSIKPVIRIKDLVAKYGDLTILKGVTVDIMPHEITVILGSSGCGKTTLLKNMLRLYEPFAGSVHFWDENVLEMNEKEFDEVLKKTGMLFQGGALLNSISIYDNVSIPLEMHTNLDKDLMDKIIKVKLKLVGLSHAMHKLPAELSGGMRKRASLARAMALDPEILFFDEPTAGLDPITSESLDALILTLKKQLNMTFVIVTHELASIHRIADKIIFLDSGEMLFYGTLKEAEKAGIPQMDRFFKVGKF
jgi:phospholipid/cholesterol/gamma-HCH transport system ATP-binding protein